MIDLFSIPNFKKVEEILIFFINLVLKGQRYQILQKVFNIVESGMIALFVPCNKFHEDQRMLNF